jgi:membrane protein
VVGGGGAISPLALLADYARRIWTKAAEDDALFLAGGVAFSILLAGVPFFLLLASGLGYALNKSEDASLGAVTDFIRNLFPMAATGDGSLLDPVLDDVVRTRGSAGVLGAIAFIWFSTRLFGSMRTVLLKAFAVPRAHGFVWGKLFDALLTVAASAIIVAWITLSAYIALARSSGVAFLNHVGLHNEQVMRPLTYAAGRLLAFVLLVTLFATLYKVLPNRRVRWRQALVGGVTTAVLFEIARSLFTVVVHRINPGSIYTGTLGAIIVVMFWVYYAALIFVVGGEVSQVHEQRLLERRPPAPG